MTWSLIGSTITNGQKLEGIGGTTFYIIQTILLFVASAGTLLWTIETITIVVKLFWIHRKESNRTKNLSDRKGESPEREGNGTEEQEQTFDETEKSSEKGGEDTDKKEQRFDETETSFIKLRR